MSETITGIVAPVVTPVDDGTLEPEKIPQSVEFTIECGCHAVVASGTGVQETAALAPDERKTVISETIAAVDERVPVLAGISYPAQPVVTDLIRHAESEGADGVLAMPPWGLPPSDDAILRYFEAIADETDLPILVYNNPTVTVDMSKETMLDVAKLDGVKYVKESSRNWKKLGWLLERIHHAGHADVFATMDVLLATLQTGGSGAVIPAPATVPAMSIYESFEAGNINAAIEAQRSFGTFPPDKVETGLTAVCKAATELSGVDVGPPRAPYDAVSDGGRESLQVWLDEHEVPEL